MREIFVRRNVFPLLLLPALALFFARQLEAWVFMWVMAFALYAGCKWLTYAEVAARQRRNQRSADGLVRANLSHDRELADKAVRAPGKSSRHARILTYCSAEVFAEERGEILLRSSALSFASSAFKEHSRRPRKFLEPAVQKNWPRALGYLLAWPGMDATAFLPNQPSSAKPQRDEWILAATKTCLGAALAWLVARMATPVGPLLTGWVGMIGLVLVLHFGSFHLLSLCWRSAGINAVPLMRSPLLARSLSEFWGRRWNTAFHELANRFTFRPLRRVAGPAGATLLVFLLSGLLHELVISLPARGGYGLPTGYFLIQGLGVIGERMPFGRRLGLGRGRRGRLFTLLVAAGPAFWLFHPPFVHNVILPMLAAIGAT